MRFACSSLARRALELSFVLVCVGFVGCSRSDRYRESEAIDQDGPSYYNRGAQPSLTQKVEGMGQPKKRIVVFNFWNDTPIEVKGLGGFVADELRRSLANTHRMLLPTDVRTLLETRDFVNGDTIKVAQLVREGRRLGVGVVVIGRIAKIVFRQRGDEVGLLRQTQSIAAVDLEIKVFDVEAGREIMSAGRAGEASSNAMVAFEGDQIKSQEFRGELARLAIRSAIGSTVGDVLRSIEKMAWQGRVAKVVGPKVYINSGRASGLVSGDILKVLTAGDDVYDPLTGAYLGRSQGQLKGTLEVVDFMGEDAAVAVIHTGGNVQETDIVRLY